MPSGAAVLTRKSDRGRESDREERRPRKQVVDRETVTTAIATLRERITRLRAVEQKMQQLEVDSVEFQGAAWFDDAIKLIDSWRNRLGFQLDEAEARRGQ